MFQSNSRTLRPLARAGAVGLCGFALVAALSPSPADAGKTPVADVGAKASADAAAAKASGDVTVQLLSITDFHSGNPADWQVNGLATKRSDGSVLPWAGTAHLSTKIKQLKAQVPNTITWSNGDNFTAYNWYDKGTADEFGLEKYERLGMEFYVVGNHDLDWRVDHLRQQLGSKKPCRNKADKSLDPSAKQGFVDCLPDSTGKVFDGISSPAISASLTWTKSGKPVWQPYQVRTFKQGGREYKVGIIGATIFEPERWPMSFNETVTSIERIDAINRASDELAAQGVTAQVLSLHEGGADGDAFADTCVGLKGPGIEAAERVSSRISAIVLGDTHKVFNCTLPDPEGRQRPVVEAGAYGSQLSQILLTLDAATGEVKRDKTISNMIPITADIPADPAIEKITEYWTALAEKRGSVIIGHTTGEIGMTRNEAGEHQMGDLLADAFLWSSRQKGNPRADLALVSTVNGQATEGWDALTHGPIKGVKQSDGRLGITYQEAFEAAGHDHRVLTVAYTGEEIVKILENQWDGGDMAPVAVSANVRYSYYADPTYYSSHSVLSGRMTIDGKPIQLGKTYQVAVPAGDFAIGGRNKNGGFLMGTDPRAHLRLDNQVLVDYIRSVGTITPSKLDRVTKVA